MANKPTAALFDHCVNVYNAMLDEAKPETKTVRDEEGHDEVITSGYQIWEGHTTTLFNRLELPAPYYTDIMRRLKDMGCVEQLRRGGGKALSKWRLIREPNEEDFKKAAEISNRRQPQGAVAALEQQIRDLNKRLISVENDRDGMLVALQSLGKSAHSHGAA